MPDNSEKMEPFADMNLDKLSSAFINHLRNELDSKSADYLEPLTRLTGGYETLLCHRQKRSGFDRRSQRPCSFGASGNNSAAAGLYLRKYRSRNKNTLIEMNMRGKHAIPSKDNYPTGNTVSAAIAA